jgi:hypothetical protein
MITEELASILETLKKDTICQEAGFLTDTQHRPPHSIQLITPR